jgi:hypothetical protein
MELCGARRSNGRGFMLDQCPYKALLKHILNYLSMRPFLQLIARSHRNEELQRPAAGA